MPTLITTEKPISSGRDQSTTMVITAPDWEMNAIEPGFGETGSKVVLIPYGGSMIPRQFGPTTRIPAARAFAITCSSRSRPASPDSRKPAERITASRTPAAPASAITPGTSSAGTAMTAISTGPGRAESEG